jgi:hypothetical protein
VGVLSQFSSNPGPKHWDALQHVFRYLKGTLDFKLTFKPSTSPSSSSPSLHGYVDADYAGDLDTRRSTSGFAFYLGGCLVSWSSKRQSVVALSTTEAEYIAAVHGGKEAVWIRTFLGELGFPLSGPIPLKVDNQSAIAVAKNPEHHSRMKHIDIAYFWLREQVALKHLDPHYVRSEENAADVLTKLLEKIKHLRCCELLGITA